MCLLIFSNWNFRKCQRFKSLKRSPVKIPKCDLTPHMKLHTLTYVVITGARSFYSFSILRLFVWFQNSFLAEGVEFRLFLDVTKRWILFAHLRLSHQRHLPQTRMSWSFSSLELYALTFFALIFCMLILAKLCFF